MHATLSHLCFIDRLVILRDITIQDISKANFKKGLLEITTFTSKHSITNENKTIQCEHCPLKSNNEKYNNYNK